MKNHFIDLANLEFEFSAFLQALLEAEGYTILVGRNHPGPGFAHSRPDLVVQSPNSRTRSIVEVKLYRAEHAQSVLIGKAIEQVRAYKAAAKVEGAILVLTAPLNDRQRERFKSTDVQIWDASKLAKMVRKHDHLAGPFAELMRAVRVGTLGPPVTLSALTDLMDEPSPSAIQGEGEILASKLEACPVGKRGKAASRFESLCMEALQLLYGQDFAGWKQQAPVERGYHRIDVVARLVPVTQFWATLASDFRARYVVFEFKNYRERITQNEIYTTEKYLYAAALRPVAIIIARGGDSESAKRTMRGALREQSKLMLCLSLAELCTLLRGRDAGDDPTGLLIEKIDTMLIEIAR
jgi:hypothetical protein